MNRQWDVSSQVFVAATVAAVVPSVVAVGRIGSFRS